MSDDKKFEPDFSEDIEAFDEPAGDDSHAEVIDDFEDENAAGAAWQSGEAQNLPAKKKSKTVTYGAIAGGVVVLLALVLHLTHSTPAPVKPVAAPAPASAEATTTEPAAPAVPPPGGGLMNGGDAVANIESMQKTPADVQNAKSETSSAPAAISPPMQPAAAQAAPLDAAPVQAAPVQAAPVQAAPVQAAPVAGQPLTPLPGAAASPPVEATSAGLNAPPAPSAAGTNAPPAAPLPAVSAGSAPAIAPVPPANPDLSKVLARLDAIDSEIKSLKTQTADKSLVQNLQGQVAALQTQVGALATAPRAAPAEAKSTAAPVPVSENAPGTPVPAPASTPKASPPRTAEHHWSLRSAQPDSAVIADHGHLRTVHVGDSVPGLGHIQSIAEQNGDWVVTGSAGKVQE